MCSHLCTSAHALDFGRVHTTPLLKAIQLINWCVYTDTDWRTNVSGEPTPRTVPAHRAHAICANTLCNTAGVFGHRDRDRDMAGGLQAEPNTQFYLHIAQTQSALFDVVIFLRMT